ncbi:clarin 3 [Phyllostomus discolor]|uniref:Clarin-3 n=1 Tax=Phyllostomus discolor TaxID=89673 RepID=A0A6J2LJ89_9CHIR|nr:clarin-3 [Phyllostomus discolor]KAF6108019.1 clarin 3 [Phyllostomus discolor]
MPTTTKTLTFLSGFFTSFGASVVLCAVLGTHQWVSSTIAISDSSSNGSIVLTYGLFRGQSTQELQGGLAEGDKDFEVLGTLARSSPKTLHSVVISSLTLSLATALLSAGFTFYNSISNPYQTFLGPLGVYTWSGLSASLAFLASVLFVANVQSNRLSEELAGALYSPHLLAARGAEAHRYGYSFWLALPVLLLNGATVAIVVLYQRARHRRKQEMRKPMEDAPRDGILF